MSIRDNSLQNERLKYKWKCRHWERRWRWWAGNVSEMWQVKWLLMEHILLHICCKRIAHQCPKVYGKELEQKFLNKILHIRNHWDQKSAFTHLHNLERMWSILLQLFLLCSLPLIIITTNERYYHPQHHNDHLVESNHISTWSVLVFVSSVKKLNRPPLSIKIRTRERDV